MSIALAPSSALPIRPNATRDATVFSISFPAPGMPSLTSFPATCILAPSSLATSAATALRLDGWTQG
eukprot:CAMPEP_0177788644 /NCGR_PEP_ID=MMETSP0491_2-20121128/22255_1 /TAXON_ID=63592 /ORGANISM="Tetraselmis chuii, Strain PLY429" /LENGTH=66 /DNA_ID=CAMNT_0019310313 /DNA_START=16 /DNA_END=213 /DNA_ORIENTATION=-